MEEEAPLKMSVIKSEGLVLLVCIAKMQPN